MLVRSILSIGRIRRFPTLDRGQHQDDQAPALHMKHGQLLAYTLADVIAVDPYPLAGARRRLLDDGVAVVINVGWCGQATPKHCIRAGPAQGHRCRETGQGDTEWKECSHQRLPVWNRRGGLSGPYGDVGNAIVSKMFRSGIEHYLAAGAAEKRNVSLGLPSFSISACGAVDCRKSQIGTVKIHSGST